MIHVLLPCFNAEPYLLQTLESLSRQTHGDFEVLLIDDGSTDATVSIAENYARQDRRIKVIRNERNLGLIATLNRGLELVRWPFVARQDQDDLCDPRRFELQLAHLRAHPETGIVGSAMNVLDNSGNQTGTYVLPSSDLGLRFRMLFNCSFIHTSVMMRTSVLQANGLRYDPAQLHAEDYDLWSRMLEVCQGYNLPDRLISYRLSPSGISRKHQEAQRARAQLTSVRLCGQIGWTGGLPPEQRDIIVERLHQFTVDGRLGFERDTIHVAAKMRAVLDRFVGHHGRSDPFIERLRGELDQVVAREQAHAHRFFWHPAAPARRSPRYLPATPGARAAVSVITPYYNTGAEFAETHAAVMGQTLQDFEWLIINDGSRDAASLAQLDAVRRLDPRIRVIDHPENRGLAAARNTGFRAAQTDYVFQLDSDDMIEPTTLEKCRWFLAAHPECSFVKGQTVGFGFKEFDNWSRSFEHSADFFEDNPVTATAMIHRAVHAAIGGYDESLRGGYEDWDFWMRAASKGHWGATIWEPLDWYRTRGDHGDRWTAFGRDGRSQFRRDLQERFHALREKPFSTFDRHRQESYGTFPTAIPFANRLLPHAQGKRLLVILPWFAMGGAERFNLAMLEQLAGTLGYEVTLCATLEGHAELRPEFERWTRDVFVLPKFLHARDHARFLSYLISSRASDAVLITGSLLAYQLVPYLRASHPHTPLLDLLHIEQPEWRAGNYPRLSLNIASCLDLTVVSSQYLKEWMLARGGEESRISLCHTNVDADRFRPDAAVRAAVRTELGLDASTPIILFAARLVEQKRPDLLLRILRTLEGQGLEFAALIVGDGPLAATFRVGLAESRLRQTKMLGEQNPDNYRRLLQASDLFLLPSQHEGISLACFEALATGVPVVCSDVGGQKELIDDTCGRLVSRGSGEAEAFVAALAELLQDRALRQRMSEAARAKISGQFTLQKMGLKLDGLIRRAGELRRQQPRAVIDPQLAYSYTIEALELNRRTEETWWHQDVNRRLREENEQQVARIKSAYSHRELQFFWATDGNFSEEQSLKASYVTGSLQPLTLVFRATGRLYLRVDVASVPGLYRVPQMELFCGDSLLMTVGAYRNSVQLAGDAAWLDDSQAGVLAATGRDPQLLLPPVDVPADAGELRLTLQIEALANG